MLVDNSIENTEGNIRGELGENKPVHSVSFHEPCNETVDLGNKPFVRFLHNLHMIFHLYGLI